MSITSPDFAVQAWEAGGPVALISVTAAIMAVIWAARREFRRADPPEDDATVKALKSNAGAIDRLTDAVHAMNLARVAHEAQTDAQLREHERRLNGIDARMDRRGD